MQDNKIMQRNDKQNNIKTTNTSRIILSTTAEQTNVKIEVCRNLHKWIVKGLT
jgi:hypothetical protein